MSRADIMSSAPLRDALPGYPPSPDRQHRPDTSNDRENIRGLRFHQKQEVHGRTRCVCAYVAPTRRGGSAGI